MLRILIIDDDELVRETLGEFSQLLGYEPILVDDPSLPPLPCQESQMCSAEHPCADVMLIDHYLPTMFGLDYIESQIRKGCKASAHSRAIITGALSTQETQRAHSLGCHVLLKPISFETFKNWLESVESNAA